MIILTVPQRTCQAEWLVYQAGRVKVFGGRRKGRRGPVSMYKYDFGPHYIASQMLNEWMPGWELRDEAHKQLCLKWVKEDCNPETIPRPGRQLIEAGADWGLEEAATVAKAEDSPQYQVWDSSQHPKWKHDSARVRCEPKDNNGRVVNREYFFV